MTISAPGKLVLLGDYAVLDGGTAMIAAVNRRAFGDIVDEDVEPSPVVKAVLEQSERSLSGSIRIDTSSFRANDTKLGIGSSAAAAVISASLALDSGAEDVLMLAVDAHRAASNGEGSGVDVAASFYGGVIASRRQPAMVEPLPSRIPGLTMSVLYANKSASTEKMVAAARQCDRWAHWMGVLKPLAEQGIDAWMKGQSKLFVSIVDRYGRAMAGLGRDAGVPIVTDEIDAAIRLASKAGGAAKPSGAGGGDVVVLFGEDPALASRVAEQTGLQLLDIEVDPRGLSRKG